MFADNSTVADGCQSSVSGSPGTRRVVFSEDTESCRRSGQRDRLAGENVVAMTGPELRGQVLGLLAAVNRLQAELRRRVGEFDPATGRPLDVGRTHRLVPHW